MEPCDGAVTLREVCAAIIGVEAGEEADNAPKTRAEADEGKEHGRRPSSKQRYYVNIGLGFEGVVESWQANGVGIYPDCHFRPDKISSTVSSMMATKVTRALVP